jgi:hypothetical protein
MSDDDIFDFNSTSSEVPDTGYSADTPKARDTTSAQLRDNFQRFGLKVDVPFLSHVIQFTFKSAAQMLMDSHIQTPARALYDIVNQTMEGDVDNRLIMYQLESKLVQLHNQKRFINAVNDTLEKVGRETSETTARFAMYIDCWVDYVDFALAAATESYVQFAEVHGLAAMPSVIERGTYPYITPSLAVLGGNPPGDRHYAHGDISQLHSRYHALTCLWITYGLERAAEKEDPAFEDVFS